MAYDTLPELCQDLIIKARQPITTTFNPGTFPYQNTEPILRVLTLDPAPYYERIAGKIDPFKRNNFTFCMDHIFPDLGLGICDCGCGQALTGRRTRWATDNCSRFANWIYNIITGKSDTVKMFVNCMAGDSYSCMVCGEVTTYATAVKKRGAFGGEITHEVDHIVPVILGGGGCWLSNYQQICVTCHIEKSAADKAQRRQYIRHVLAPGNKLF